MSSASVIRRGSDLLRCSCPSTIVVFVITSAGLMEISRYRILVHLSFSHLKYSMYASFLMWPDKLHSISKNKRAEQKESQKAPLHI
jgi:hypothetical protein